MKLVLDSYSNSSCIVPSEFKKIEELNILYADISGKLDFFLHPKLDEWISYFEKNQIPLQIVTNGINLYPDMVKKISKLNWQNFNISINSFNQKLYRDANGGLELADLLNTYYELRKILPLVTLSTYGTTTELLTIENKEEYFKLNTKKYGGCRWIREYLFVNPEGNVSPCQWNDEIIGNIKQKSYEEIFSDGAYIILRTNIKRGILGNCKNCRGFG